ncbi:MAG TPA: YihY/virulence factor BrkB family protein [Planctomycetota bacterium]
MFDALRRLPPIDFALRLQRAIVEDDLPGLAARMAYYFMLSLFPGLILLVAVLDFLPLEAALVRLQRDLGEALPGPSGALVLKYLEDFAQRKPSGVISLWGLAALWASSRGLADARKSLNHLFGVRERRSAWRLRLVSLGLTVALLVLLGVAYTVLVGGPELGRALADFALLGAYFPKIWAALRWPLVLGFLTTFVVLAYRYLPSRRLRFRHLLGGAVPVVAGWIGLGLGFRLYLRLSGNFDEIYGSLASVILLMVFLWAFSLLLLFGGEIAAQLAGVRVGAAVPGIPNPAAGKAPVDAEPADSP